MNLQPSASRSVWLVPRIDSNDQALGSRNQEKSCAALRCGNRLAHLSCGWVACAVTQTKRRAGVRPVASSFIRLQKSTSALLFSPHSHSNNLNLHSRRNASLRPRITRSRTRRTVSHHSHGIAPTHRLAQQQQVKCCSPQLSPTRASPTGHPKPVTTPYSAVHRPRHGDVCYAKPFQVFQEEGGSCH